MGSWRSCVIRRAQLTLSCCGSLSPSILTHLNGNSSNLQRIPFTQWGRVRVTRGRSWSGSRAGTTFKTRATVWDRNKPDRWPPNPTGSNLTRLQRLKVSIRSLVRLLPQRQATHPGKAPPPPASYFLPPPSAPPPPLHRSCCPLLVTQVTTV